MSKACILVVEDERLVAEDIKKNLEDFRCVVSVVVPSRDFALQKIEEHRPDLVLMDIVLQRKADGIAGTFFACNSLLQKHHIVALNSFQGHLVGSCLPAKMTICQF